MTLEKRKKLDRKIDSFIEWVGSFASLVVHTAVFFVCFLSGLIWGYWDTILLVLTTMVSLEAIYLAIFIQMSINRNTESLEEVEKDIDELQEDVEEIAEDVEELQEDDKEEESQEEIDRRLLRDIQDNLIKITSDMEQLKMKK